MKFKNPEGEKNLFFSEENGIHTLHIEDFSRGSRSFSLQVTLQGKKEQLRIIGRAISEKSDQKDWRIKLLLLGEEQSAEISLHAIANNFASVVLDATGILEKNSKNGSLQIKERIVLFSGSAIGKALPVLRVETDSVKKASHSASIARFSEDIFFYCESRGISPQETKKLLKNGFLRN